MLIRIPRGWERPEASATPEAAFLGRRALGAGLGAVALGGGLLRPGAARAQGAAAPVMRNPRYVAGRAVSPEREATTYNNYYEFGSHKTIARAAQALRTAPWTLKVDGMVARPREFDLDDLRRTMASEERVYRHRCVEAWAMTVPWSGFPLADLVRLVEPRPEARFVVFETAAQRDVMPGLRQSWYPWPYVEGCTIDEALNELPFLATGIYGKPLPPQNGGPLRVHFPWKYGFKSGKSLVRVSFTDQRPVSFWERIQPQEYGFWANVNPAVAHPRWSQATERLIGSEERVPTQIFNGYGEFVAGLYAARQSERLYL